MVNRTRIHFNRELLRLHEDVLGLGALARASVVRATQALINRPNAVQGNGRSGSEKMLASSPTLASNSPGSTPRRSRTSGIRSGPPIRRWPSGTIGRLRTGALRASMATSGKR